MSKSDVEFLIEASLSARIRHVCGGHNVRCAVAFWGAGVAESLFPYGFENVTLVCDISMRGTPKAALLELGAPTNPKLLVRDGLHAKIYVSDRGAVIGSANASENGLGLQPGGSGRLVEAGVYCPAGTPPYFAAEEAVYRLIGAATPVNDEDVGRAPERSHELRPTLSETDLGGLSLLEQLQQAPGKFHNLSVAVVTDEALDEKGAETVKSHCVVSDNRLRDEDDIGEAILQDDGDGAIETLGRNVLMFFMPGEARSGWYVKLYTSVRLLPEEQPEFVFAGSRRARGPLRALIRGKKLSRADWDVVHRVSEQRPKTWAYTPEDFADALASARAGTTSRNVRR